MADKIIVMARGLMRVVVEENMYPGKVGVHLAHPAQVETVDVEEKVAVLKKAGWEVMATTERLPDNTRSSHFSQGRFACYGP